MLRLAGRSSDGHSGPCSAAAAATLATPTVALNAPSPSTGTVPYRTRAVRKLTTRCTVSIGGSSYGVSMAAASLCGASDGYRVRAMRDFTC